MLTAAHESTFQRVQLSVGFMVGLISFLAAPIWLADVLLQNRSILQLFGIFAMYVVITLYLLFSGFMATASWPVRLRYIVDFQVSMSVVPIFWLLNALSDDELLGRSLFARSNSESFMGACFYGYIAACVAYIGLRVGSAVVGVVNKFIAAPIAVRKTGAMTPVEIAIENIQLLIYALDNVRQPWRETRSRRQLTFAFHDTIHRLRASIMLAASVGGADTQAQASVRTQLNGLLATLDVLLSRIPNMTTAATLHEIRSELVEVQHELLCGNWPIAPDMHTPVKSRLASLVRPVTLVLVPVAVALALPIVPGLSLAPDVQRLMQVVLILNGLLSLPIFDAGLRETITSTVQGK
ncbi:hypothetical protein AB0J72_53245 [Dactylosporangium sp. NPDC049742]|uniref:hypothetical protein n=1 Tax=Dactylosporangium sp. NPDC049742 TaxID=3154737 RepID=UPI00342A93CD